MKVSSQCSRYKNLVEIVRKYKCRCILEIGTWNGKHASAMIREAQFMQSNLNQVTYYGFDLFEDYEDRGRQFKDSIRNL